MTALEVSKYFLRKIDKESFELYDNGISNLKMQKLLFFAQQTFFSVYNKPLFKEDMEAWQLGPVVPKVYHHYKIYGRNNIDIFQENLQIDNLDWNIMMILDFVYLKYAKYTAYALVDITHSLPCWINNINSHILNSHISINDAINSLPPEVGAVVKYMMELNEKERLEFMTCAISNCKKLNKD